jgi:protocatechuate 3,4-dioxygenase beta subunit
MGIREKPQRRITRREALGVLGVAGIAGLGLVIGCNSDDNSSSTPTPGATRTPTSAASGTATAAPSATATPAPTSAAAINCVVTPAETEGPYFVDEMLNRSDIRPDPTSGAVSEGVPLVLTVRVYNVGNNMCEPVSGAHVDIWHCDAAGHYSDESANNTVGQKFLRGYQVTDENGAVTFTTIYPGWYQGRTVHIHFKVRTYDGSSKTYEFTSQLFFDDSLSDQVFAAAPYNARGNRDTRNSNDNIYDDMLLMNVTPSGGGYASTFDVGLQM